jgi:ribonucleoside-diphosphate reductase alpha chain
MKINRRFTKAGQDALANVEYENRTSKIINPDGSVVFEMTDAQIPKSWSQLATDIMVSKYFRKAGVPQTDEQGNVLRDPSGKIITGPERSARQVIARLAGCWRHWGESHGYFDAPEDAQAFYDELAHMLVHQMAAPNSPQWFNTGLHYAYGITGPSQGHYYVDPKTGLTVRATDAYTHPQPHACQPYDALISTPAGPLAIGDIVTQKLLGLEVYDGRERGSGLTRVLAVKSNGEKQVLRIVLKNGIHLEATADHLVWAIDERRTAGQWVRVDQLSPGQRMHVSTATSVTKTSEEEQIIECALAGWLQGDGFVGQYLEGTNRSLTLEFMTVNEDEHQFVIGGIARVFEGVHFHVRTVEAQDPTLTIRRIRLYGEILRPFVENYGLFRRGSDHQVPAAVRTAGAQAQRAYLSALFQTDGTVRRRLRNGSQTCDVVLTTVSRDLANGVQALLLNLGIYSRVQIGSEKRERRRIPYFVSIGYAQAREKFRREIGFISAVKKQKLDAVCGCQTVGKDLPALREEVVQRIELIGTKPVYDIQTESGQYLSNNVVVHNCFIQSVSDDLVNEGGIMDLWTREARLFKYGSGTGSNFSHLRGDNEPLSGGGRSSGLMSFLKIGDRAAGAIKSGGTTRRAAKMVCLNLDHPDVEQFINWKVREELKVAAMAEGIKRLTKDQRDLAAKLGLKLDYDFNGEAYMTVSGQNSNNSVRIPNKFFKAVADDGDWELTFRTNGKTAKKLKARDLWDQIAVAAWRCADPGVQYDDTINQWHTCPRHGRINASNPCVTGDTRVLTPGGIWRRIDQMIHLPSRVVTNLHGSEIHATDGAFPTGQKEVFELRTVGGYSLKLTADHQVWTRARGWVAAKDLNGGDEVRLVSQPAATQAVGEPRDPQFFQLLGIYLSDANGCANAIRLESCLGAAAAEPFVKYAAQLWQDRPYDDDYVNEAMLDDDFEDGGDTLTATVGRRLLSRLTAFVSRDDLGRHLSDEAFTAGLPAQKHLLRGLFSADGQTVNGTLELIHTHAGLLEDVQLLLLGFGVKSSRHALNGRYLLRIDPGSLQNFSHHIGLLPGRKESQLAVAEAFVTPRSALAGNWDKVHGLTPLGRRQVFDLTEPHTHSFVAGGITVHNCSEYMFLDDTACNLASLNVLTFFDQDTRRFDIEGFKHATRLWTIALEISVLMASFPSESIARLSYEFRTLGLGYANLGAMLMQAGVPYDSAKGRAVCAALTAVMTGESYATSAEMAGELGAFPGYPKNRAEMLRVIRNHRRAAYDVTGNPAARRNQGDFETLDIKPVGIDAQEFSEFDPLVSSELLLSSRDCWDRALSLGEKNGYRNAQTTVIAPTGTIGLLMDCDTTGVEPDFALVKFKKLAGGGYFKIANQSLRPALVNLGYPSEQIHDILRYVMGTLTLHDAPHIHWERLRALGFVDEELEKIDQGLPGQFEISFAFSPWTLGEKTLSRLNISPATWQAPGFNLLRHLGFTKKQIDEANDIVCGRGTVEGAPHLRIEHYPVFDCANKCGRVGKRFIRADGHIRMMAAAQPFISGAISKTINLPHEASVDEIKECYYLSWQLGLKANALYRDGSKLSQPLNVKSDTDLDQQADEESEENISAAREEVAQETANAASQIAKATSSDNLQPAQPLTIEKIIERIVERPLRRRLPDTRKALTHKFDVAGHEGYITVGLYHDGSPGEVFITMAKEGSTIGGLMDTIATLVSVSLQYGVPVESLVRKFEHVRFEPSGMTRNSDIPFAKSLVDYIFRWLAMEFVPGYRAANSPKRESRGDSQEPTPPPAKEGNGNGHRVTQDDARPFAYSEAEQQSELANRAAEPAPQTGGTSLRLALVSDPLSQQGTGMQADAPACDVCGSITVRSGMCYKCLNCGNSMGCS